MRSARSSTGFFIGGPPQHFYKAILSVTEYKILPSGHAGILVMAGNFLNKPFLAGPVIPRSANDFLSFPVKD
jgi:hypothetical protein